MCAYKLVTVKFKWWGLQTKVENLIHEVRLIFFLNIVMIIAQMYDLYVAAPVLL